MFCIFNTEISHHILDANRNTYKIPCLHPSRTLPFHDIVYIVEGEWEIGIGDQILTAKQDHILILPANIHHSGVRSCRSDTKTIYIHSRCETGDGHADTSYIPAAPFRISLPLLIDVSNHPDVKKHFTKTVEEKLAGNVCKASAYFTLLLFDLAEAIQKDDGSKIALQIKGIIRSHLEQNLTNYQIADRLHICTRTAENIFKKHTNMTIHQYYLSQKLEKAVFYLEYMPDMHIAEIALTLGFHDAFHFSKQFKRKYGVAPSKYRGNVIQTEYISCR